MSAVSKYALPEFQAPTNLRLTRTALIEEYPHTEYIYGRWDTVFGAWKRTAQGVVEFVPNFTFEMTIPFAQYVDADPWYENPGRVKFSKIFEDYQDLFQQGLFDLPESGESPDEVNAYLALIPPRFRRSCEVLGRFSWLGLEACWYFEEFSDWLQRSRWHGRFATAIWYLANAKHMPRLQRRALHERMYSERLIALLSTFMPELEAKRSLNILKRLGGRAPNESDLSSLRILAGSPQKIRAVFHLRGLKVESLRTLAVLPTWLAGPATATGVINGGSAALEFLECIQRHPDLLDRRSQTRIAKRIEAIREESDVYDLQEWWEDRIAAATPFPNPPLILPPPFEPIDTLEKLRHEGRLMGNCAATYFRRIIEGTSYFYHRDGAEPATLRLQFSDGQWRTAEIKGLGNVDLLRNVDADIRKIVAHAQPSN